jgi:hypothetical protein
MNLTNLLQSNKYLCLQIKELFEKGNIENALKICSLKRHIYSIVLEGYTNEFHATLANLKSITLKKDYNELLKNAKEYVKNNSDFQTKLNEAKILKKETLDFDSFLKEAIELKKNDNNFKKYLKNKTNSCDDSGLYAYYETILQSNELIETEFILNSEIFLFYEECLCMNPL